MYIDLTANKLTTVFMTLQELYDYITSKMTPEQALKKMLESSLIEYQHLKFSGEGKEIHPLMLIAMCGFELGWSIALPKDSETDNTEMNGIVMGTKEFLDELYGDGEKDAGPDELSE
jgi:hypothetical protein